MKELIMLPCFSILALVLIFLFYLLVQSLFINGVRISASGETLILPDGTEKDSEMILYPFYKWLCQMVKRKVYYSGGTLQDLLNRLTISLGPGFTQDYPIETILYQAKLIDNDIEIERKDSDTYVFFKYIEEYKFSKYLRKPIIQCIICMASFWGLFTYWLPVYFLLGVNIFTITLWVINTICLSYTNYLVFKKL